MVTLVPAHPGELVRSFCLNPLGLTVTDAAKALGIRRYALLDLLNGRADVSPAMARRLERVFNTSAERWMAIQQQYDLWRARQAVRLGESRQLTENSVGE